MLVAADFNTGVLATIEPSVEIFQDRAGPLRGERLIHGRVDDDRLDAFLGAAAEHPLVLAASKSYIYTVQEAP